jgi:hypothetical protein
MPERSLIANGPIGKPKFADRLVDLPRRRAFLQEERRFARVVEEHPVADEAEGVAGDARLSS